MLAVGDVIVPSLADRNALVKLVAAIERLAQFQQVASPASSMPSWRRLVLRPTMSTSVSIGKSSPIAP